LIEAGNDKDKKRIKLIMQETEKQLAKSDKLSGAKILIEKLKEIKA
jgi:hypothetical protein